MKVFIIDWVKDLTIHYHSGGGLVVIARDVDHARELVACDEQVVRVTEQEWASAQVLSVRGKPEPKVRCFPDAGCC